MLKRSLQKIKEKNGKIHDENQYITLIEDIIKKFSEKKIIVILINCNILKNINFKKIFSKYFANNKKNISIYSNFLILKYNRND